MIGQSKRARSLKGNFLECLHVDISLLLLYSVDISGRHVIKYFSHRHKLHLLVTFEYDRACFLTRKVNTEQ